MGARLVQSLDHSFAQVKVIHNSFTPFSQTLFSIAFQAYVTGHKRDLMIDHVNLCAVIIALGKTPLKHVTKGFSSIISSYRKHFHL